MTPSNDPNGKPLIYRIADALGITHLVVAAQHSHLMSEITGLVDALSAKANASDVQTALEGKQNTLTFDTTPTDNSTNPVTSGGVKAALDGKQDALTFDTTPTTSSTNPVTSGGVKTALNGKQDTLTFDTTPTANSTNPVTSGGVKAALDGKAEQAHTHSAIGDEESSITVGEGEINIELSDPITHSGGEINITVSKLPNFQRAINNPDSTPTANSNNLVTSGGVYDALDGKAPKSDTEVNYVELDTSADTGQPMPIYLSNYFQNGNSQATLLVDNISGDNVLLHDAFYDGSGSSIAFLTDTPSVLNADSVTVFRVLKCIATVGIQATYWVICDGSVEY